MNTSLWHNARFKRFFTAMVISNLGDWFDIFAVQIIFVQEFHASPMMMGQLILLYFIPGILFSHFAGTIADHYNKRNLMITADILSAALTAMLIVNQNILTALLLIFARSTIASLNLPAQQAYIKAVVNDKNLLQASSYTTMAFQAAKVLGPILGAVILIIAPPRFCLGINAISFTLSFLILLTLPLDQNAPFQKSKRKLADWLNDIKAGRAFVRKHRLISNAILLTATWFFCSIVRNSQLPIFLNHLLPKEPHVLGYILGLDGLGAVLSSILLNRIQNIYHYARYFCIGFCLVGLGTLGIACYQPIWNPILLYVPPFILGMGSGISMVTYNYLIRKESTSEKIGSVYGVSSATQNLALASGSLFSGIMVMHLGVRLVYLVLAFILIMSALIALVLLRKE